MKLIVILSSVLLLSGCGCTSHCVMGFGPGNPLFETTAKYYNDRDPCQIGDKGPEYKQPEFCGASRGKVVTINKTGPNSYLMNRY